LSSWFHDAAEACAVSLSPQSDPRSDAALVDAIRDGDGDAFQVLYLRYRDWVVRLAYRFTGNRDHALDCLQETFAYLLGKLPTLRLSARLTTLLYPVVKHTALAIRRKAGRTVSGDDLLSEIAAPDQIESGSVRSELAAVMAGLTAGQREVVLMRFVDDMTLAEIAAALEIPSGTVKSRLHNALAALRDDARTKAYFDR